MLVSLSGFVLLFVLILVRVLVVVLVLILILVLVLVLVPGGVASVKDPRGSARRTTAVQPGADGPFQLGTNGYVHREDDAQGEPSIAMREALGLKYPIIYPVLAVLWTGNQFTNNSHLA